MTAESARSVAHYLLEVDAFGFRPDRPVRTPSGRATPVTLDAGPVIAHPRLRRRLVAVAVDRLAAASGVEAFDAVAGAELRGLPLAAWLADALALPMVYVRKQPKGFGRNAAIEGRLTEGARVLLVDDVATDGGSKLAFVDALRAAGGRVEHALVVCAAAIWPESERALREAGLSLHALTTWPDLAVAARERAVLPADLLDEIDAYLSDPAAWEERAATTD
jgi:orotate phosphoribosyltransferase